MEQNAQNHSRFVRIDSRKSKRVVDRRLLFDFCICFPAEMHVVAYGLSGRHPVTGVRTGRPYNTRHSTRTPGAVRDVRRYCTGDSGTSENSPPPPKSGVDTKPEELDGARPAEPTTESPAQLLKEIEASRAKKRNSRSADSTDAVASFLTRRFGIGAGFAWLGILAVGSIGEQIKTRLEYRNEMMSTKDVEDAKVVKLASGVEYVDKKIGGGSYPQKGFLTVLDIKGSVDGTAFEDTRANGRPIVLFFGSRPFTLGMCAGLEEAISSMRVGGRRIVTVPPQLGFGNETTVLFPDETNPEKQGKILPGSTLVYDVELKRVSIPPS